tara:strand:+ start:1432 stop:1635 length:204 start_codon:yes stop_codon:yes gene_type:complete
MPPPDSRAFHFSCALTVGFRGSTGIARAVVDAFIEVPGRERGSHASSEKSRARAVDKARDVNERMNE